MTTYRIGEITEQTELSADTLRYYEKIGLLPNVRRDATGTRAYSDKDISRIRFIQRAQKMNFTLAEINGLLALRTNPQYARTEVRELTRKKLAEIEEHLQDLTTLRNELTLLINLCTGSRDGCPIIDSIEDRE